MEEISAEQNLPLSACYRRTRQFLDEGLMILERIVVTQTGKKLGESLGILAIPQFFDYSCIILRRVVLSRIKPTKRVPSRYRQ